MINQDSVNNQTLPRNKPATDLLCGTRLIFTLCGLCVLYWAFPYIVSLASGPFLLQIPAGAKNGFLSLVVNITAQILAITGLTFSGLKISGLKWNDIGFAARSNTLKYILGGIAVGAIYGILIKFSNYHHAVWLRGIPGIITATRIVIVSPFLEELFCRGLIFRLMQQGVNLRVNILINSFIYALTHYHFVDFLGYLGITGTSTNSTTLGAILVYFVLGAVCALIRHRSKSIWPAISVHITYNLILFLL